MQPAALPAPTATPVPPTPNAEGRSADPTPPGGPRAGWLSAGLGTAAAYAVAGLLTVPMVPAGGWASPIAPAAGIALAAVLVLGWRALPGVGLGALVVASELAAGRGAPGWTIALPLLLAMAATLQAVVGAALVRRFMPQPLRLDAPRDIGRFFLLGGVLASLVQPLLTLLAVSSAGLLPAGALPAMLGTGWMGDTVGVVLGAPVVLALIGQPRGDWAARRLTLALPLVVTTGLLTTGMLLVARWDEQRARTVFERDAAMAAAGLQARITHAQGALEAMRGLFLASDNVTAEEFRHATRAWISQGGSIQALGYSERVARADLAAYEARVQRADGLPMRVFERDATPGGPLDPVVVRLIEPSAGNAAARGVNALSVPQAREAIARAVATGRPAATMPFSLTQNPQASDGVVLYQALYPAGQATGTPPAGGAAFTGVVFATLRLASLMSDARVEVPAYLQWCLFERPPGGTAVRLHGPEGCEHPADARGGPLQLVHQRGYQVGQRRWQLVLRADAAAQAAAGAGNVWLFSTTGMLAAAVLSALLLTVTGRNVRIERAVLSRTADLRREVSERERTSRALMASEQRLRSIVDHAPVGIVFADLDGRVREANPRMCDMVGQSAEQLDGRDLIDTILAEDREPMRDALRRLLAESPPEAHCEARLVHRDGSQRWVQTRWSVLRGTQGQPLWLVAVLEDITERLKRAEAEQGRQAAESANQAKSEFLSRMSHELRTPLNAMLGFAQLLELDRKPPLATHQASWVGQILQAGWHLLEMINDTLDLSRIEAGVMRLHTEPVALAEVLAQSQALVARAAAERGIALDLPPAIDGARVLADATRLKQILTNLLSNAIKYNKDGGQVRVAVLQTPQGAVEVQVQDTGAGIAPAQMAQLFQPFNRLGWERSQIEGTGIGLVISQRLAELMGGSLRADSVPGVGATFVLTLPAAPAAVQAPVEAAALPAATDRYRARRVHYIEDNDANVQVMRGIFSQRPQVALTVSRNGLQGLAALRAAPPDLLLLDMHLPDIDGLTLLRRLRETPSLARLPVLAVSADATTARVDAALAAGVRHYLAKPLNVAAVLERVDEVLEAADTGAGALAEAPDDAPQPATATRLPATPPSA